MASLDDLLRDPNTRRCLRVFSDRSGWTIDDLLACYSSRDVAAAVGIPFDDGERGFQEHEPSDDELLARLSALVGDPEERSFEDVPAPGSTTGLDATERGWYERLSELTSSRSVEESAPEQVAQTTAFGPPPDAPRERVLLPEDLIRQIDDAYAVVSRWGVVTDGDLAEWLREATAGA